MGLFSSLFVLTFVRDLGLGAVAVVDALAPGQRDERRCSRRSARAPCRSSPRSSRCGASSTRGAPRRVVRVDVPIADLPPSLHGFTIAQISDIHVGPTIRRPYLEAIVAAVNRLDADMVAITGDLVDGSVARSRRARRAARRPALARGQLLRHRQPRVLLGRRGLGRSELRRLGLTRADERARRRAPRRRGAGRRRRHRLQRRPLRPRPGAATRRPRSPAARRRRCALLLAHQPRSAEAAEAAGFDLQLSGHTHGGQFLPWNFLVRLQQPFTAGLTRWRRMWVYTSRGTGYWGPPKRFGAPSEITLLRLVPAARPAASPRRLARAPRRPRRRRPGLSPARPSTIRRFCRRRLPPRLRGSPRVHFRSLCPGRAGCRRRLDVRRPRQHAAAGADVRRALLRDDPAADEAAEGSTRR